MTRFYVWTCPGCEHDVTTPSLKAYLLCRNRGACDSCEAELTYLQWSTTEGIKEQALCYPEDSPERARYRDEWHSDKARLRELRQKLGRAATPATVEAT